jgi:IS5 family transposase
MKQLTLATTGFARYAKTTRRTAFLAEMERVVPWLALCELIGPFYPKPGNGRLPVGAKRMLRIYFLQHWFNLSDPAVEEALYDSQAMRRFVGIDLGREPVPDETTVCRFRHLLEEHDLGRQLFDEVQRHLAAKGLKVAIGTMSTLRSSIRRPRPRMPTRRAIPRCIRRRKETSGTSGSRGISGSTAAAS